jgi:hypothetical protein
MEMAVVEKKELRNPSNPPKAVHKSKNYGGGYEER